MRAPFLAMIIFVSATLAGCMQNSRSSSNNDDDVSASKIPANSWVELHLNWTRGGRPVWHNTTYTASENEEWTSDGNSYFYARLVNASQDHDSCVREGPANAEASLSKPHVFIARWERGCLWALHPSYECWRVSFCEQRTLPGGPPPTANSS